MKITFLGTNGWYDTKTGNTTCILVETKNEYIILDAGGGLHKLDLYIKSKTKPIYLFLSHYHIDHITGLHTLVKFNFPQGMTIHGPRGLKKLFSTFIRQPYTAHIKQSKTKITLIELNKNTQGLPIEVTFKKLIHSSFCYGYRFVVEGKILSYCTDTGLCPNLLALARHADVLITECALKSGVRDDAWPHLNPEDAASVAKESGAKRLILTHFDARNYQTLEERRKAQKHASKIFPRVIAATDHKQIIC